MKTGFGRVQAKPACSVAPFALMPDELGDDWQEGRVCEALTAEVNGVGFGSPRGDAMAYGFHDLIACCTHPRPAGRDGHRFGHRVQCQPCRGRIDLHFGTARDRDDCRWYITVILIRPLVAELAVVAPGVRLEILPLHPNMRIDMNRGAIDAIIAPEQFQLHDHPNEFLFEERHVPLVRRGLHACAWRHAPH